MKQIIEFQLFKKLIKNNLGLPWWLSDKESACQCRRLTQAFETWPRKSPTCHGETKPVHRFNYWTCALDLGTTAAGPMCHSYWIPHALEPALCNCPSHHTKGRVLQLESLPHSLQLEGSLCSNADPAQPKINTEKSLNIFLWWISGNQIVTLLFWKTWKI